MGDRTVRRIYHCGFDQQGPVDSEYKENESTMLLSQARITYSRDANSDHILSDPFDNHSFDGFEVRVISITWNLENLCSRSNDTISKRDRVFVLYQRSSNGNLLIYVDKVKVLYKRFSAELRDIFALLFQT